MSPFELYFKLGVEHILDINGRDHILFVLAMMCIYRLKDWKAILAVVTSFTIAHSLTLALSVFHIVRIDSGAVELLIAATIFFTCIENLFLQKLHKKRVLFSGFFGLIHGLGFSNYLNSLLGKGDVFKPLLAFNLGVELGQIVIVGIYFISLFLLGKLLRSKNEWIVRVFSVLILIQSFVWMVDRI